MWMKVARGAATRNQIYTVPGCRENARTRGSVRLAAMIAGNVASDDPSSTNGIYQPSASPSASSTLPTRATNGWIAASSSLTGTIILMSGSRLCGYILSNNPPILAFKDGSDGI